MRLRDKCFPRQRCVAMFVRGVAPPWYECAVDWNLNVFYCLSRNVSSEVTCLPVRIAVFVQCLAYQSGDEGEPFMNSIHRLWLDAHQWCHELSVNFEFEHKGKYLNFRWYWRTSLKFSKYLLDKHPTPSLSCQTKISLVFPELPG